MAKKPKPEPEKPDLLKDIKKSAPPLLIDTLPDKVKNLAYKKLIEEQWRKGDLRYLLHDYQKKLYDKIRDMFLKGSDVNVVNCARRFGKSTIAFLICIEMCVSKPNMNILYCSKTKSNLEDILQGIKPIILQDAPEDCIPTYNTHKKKFFFPNGSIIHLHGLEDQNQASIRGNSANLVVIDESAFIKELDFIIKSTLMPMTSKTDGPLLLISTPPETPGHDFYRIAMNADEKDRYVKFTIMDDETYTEEKRTQIFETYGGINSTFVRREFFCEFITEVDVQVMPEFKEALHSYDYKPDERLFPFYHRYVVADVGYNDLTVALFGYYDFNQAKLIVQDELILRKQESVARNFTHRVKDYEEKLWGAGQKIHMRLADVPPLFLNTMIDSAPTYPDGRVQWWGIANNKEPMAQTNKVRVALQQNQIVILPRCQHTIKCCEYAIWVAGKIGKELGREKAYGHFDAMMALTYMWNNVDRHTNPIPPMLNFNPQTQFDPYAQQRREEYMDPLYSTILNNI